MRKGLLVLFLLNAFYLILSTSNVFAACLKDVSQPPSGANLGCNSGLSCERLVFPATSGPACNDPAGSDCWCVSDNNSTPTPTPTPTGSPLPTSSPTPTPIVPPPSCNAANPGDLSSRPVPCENCNQTQNLTPSCATTFSANDSVDYTWGESNFSCNNLPYLQKTWSGTVTVDPKDTKIPFVGQKGNENEQKYLADYFEGTKYYKSQLDLSTCNVCQTQPQSSGCQTCQQKLQQIILTAGVWPKLAPLELQDTYKKQMIDRAVKSLAGSAGYDQAIHNYLVSVKNDSGQLLQAQLTDFLGHTPPKLNEENYPTKYDAWQKSDNGKWTTLWPAVPMFSKEDTSGFVTSYVGPRALDTISPQNPKKEIERVPHLARLNEVTQALQRLLLPFQSTQQLLANSQTTNATALHSTVAKETQTDNVDSKVLGDTCVPLETSVEVVSEKPFVYRIVISRTACAPKGTLGDIQINPPGNYNNPGGTGPHIQSMTGDNLTYYSNYQGADGFMPQVQNEGDLANYIWTLRADRLPEGFKIGVNTPFKYTNKNFPTPPPVIAQQCGLPAAASVPNCNKNNVVQSNGGDNLCCNQTTIKISGVDTFLNPKYDAYKACLVNQGTCYANCFASGRSEKQCDNVCNCDKPASQDVSRGVQVALSHPYLFKIWQQTNDSVSGLLNILRPAAMPKFNDNPAASEIAYNYQSNNQNHPGNRASPSKGQFYFPFLGGIQEAKEDILKLLNPSGDSSNQSSSGGGASPTPTPKPVTLDYTISYRDSSTISLSADLKKRIIDNVHANGNWDKTKIDSSFDFVYNQAVANGWNPAFVIALWIEESGAGAFDSAYALGCEGAPKTDLAGQLNCLFTRPYADKSFEEFMCRYSDGHYPCDFSTHPNFPGGIKTWYNCTTGIRCPYK